MKRKLLWALGACFILSWQIKDILSQPKNTPTLNKNSEKQAPLPASERELSRR